MKKSKFAIAMVLSAILTQNTYAQMPVIDNAALAKWVVQIMHMKEQLSQLIETNRSLSGARGLENLANNPESRRYLPSDYAEIMAKGYGNSKEIRKQYELAGVKDTKLIPGSDSAKTFEQNAQSAATGKATFEEAYRQASNRIGQIEVLLNHLKQTKDPKDALDLNARIAAEQALLTNEQTKLQMLANIAQAEDRLQAQRAKENQMKASGGSIPRF